MLLVSSSWHEGVLSVPIGERNRLRSPYIVLDNPPSQINFWGKFYAHAPFHLARLMVYQMLDIHVPDVLEVPHQD